MGSLLRVMQDVYHQPYQGDKILGSVRLPELDPKPYAETRKQANTEPKAGPPRDACTGNLFLKVETAKQKLDLTKRICVCIYIYIYTHRYYILLAWSPQIVSESMQSDMRPEAGHMP